MSVLRLRWLLSVAGLLLPLAGAMAQGCYRYDTRCQAGDSAACDRYVDCIGGLLDQTLDPVDPPELRRLRHLCQEGDGEACTAETIWRRSSIGGYDAAIDAMNSQFGPSWRDSFGLGQ